MARPIVLSNGELHVGLNDFGTVHDFYYPYVGFENHSAGKYTRHKIGVMVDGALSWIDNPNNPNNEWVFCFRYPTNALIGHTIARNDRLGIVLEFDDFVDVKSNIFFRNVHIINIKNEHREVKLFMHQAFAIGDSRSNTDTAQYLPENDAILHYRGRRAFIISGEYNREPFDQHSIGLFGIEGKEGTFRDAEDGELGCNNVEHGRVDSTIRFVVKIEPLSSQRVYYWIACGKSNREALALHNQVQETGPWEYLRRTTDWWHEWMEPASKIADKIDPELRQNFLRSVMIIKSQIDNRGAIIASTDTSMLNYSRDAYAYCWPRDGAFTIWPLIRMGYKDEALKFFQFMQRGMHSDGYMMHKYRADGSLGSSWHSYVHGDIIAPPIQEDETALPLFMFAQYYNMHKSEVLLKEFYGSLVIPMADFLAEYVDRGNGLPKPSYDLWEQEFLTTTFTTATVYAALSAASDLASDAKDQENAVKWRVAAGEIQAAAHKFLYSEETKMFLNGVVTHNGRQEKNSTIDCSSLFGAYTFGLFASDSEEINTSIETVRKLFKVDEGAIGLPRYENDDYRRVHKEITGNYWFISSLWMAQYDIDRNNLAEAKAVLDWVSINSLHTGVMSEQMDPVTNEIISPAPLTWTHAEYLSTVLNLLDKTK